MKPKLFMRLVVRLRRSSPHARRFATRGAALVLAASLAAEPATAVARSAPCVARLDGRSFTHCALRVTNHVFSEQALAGASVYFFRPALTVKAAAYCRAEKQLLASKHTVSSAFLYISIAVLGGLMAFLFPKVVIGKILWGMAIKPWSTLKRAHKTPSLIAIVSELSEGLKRARSKIVSSQVRSTALWMRQALQREYQDDFDAKAEAAMSKANHLELVDGYVTVGQKVLRVRYENRAGRHTRYLRVGRWVLVSDSLRVPKRFRLPRGQRLVRVNEDQIQYDGFLIPMFALAQERKRNWKGQVVQDDGTGRGIFLSLALQLGARRVGGIDEDRSRLLRAKKHLTARGYQGRMVRPGNPADEKMRRGENFILLNGDLIREEPGTSERFWENILGRPPTLRIANIGFVWRDAQNAVIEDLLRSKYPHVAILGGFETDMGRHFSQEEALRPFLKANWTVTVAQYLMCTAILVSPPAAAPGLERSHEKGLEGSS